ncbi:uncharacterized protein LOC129796457 [Lutzomyia longipalpis]|uniref:uncharacterized protein LOC129796457 n=1 Tax=Lutzomyia longipalpis TaxID=7200 RepID=UPI002483A61F|nr:uncharacterized protein LOC129796457 [Lutzomyia longipalpis]
MFARMRCNFLCILLWINISLVVSEGRFAYLNDLPLSALLRVKKTFSEMFSSDTCSREEKCDGKVTEYRFIDAPNQLEHTLLDGNHQNITAAPLIGHIGHPMQKIHKSAEGWQEMKPSKVQKIFQLSVTALAFLAFGGYLLCMIVQAIKSKGTTYYHPAMMPMNGAAATSIKKKRPSFGRRRKRRNAPENDDQMATPSPDDLYRGLVLAAEQFVKLNQI